MVEEKQTMKEITKRFNNLGIMFDKPITNDLINVYIEAFKDEGLTPEQFLIALKEVTKKSKFFPKPVEMLEIIKPPKKENNPGIEFVNRILELQQRHGTEKMKDYVHKEFGEVGLKVYIQLKDELRHLQIDDIQTFKAQTRSLYNSYYEREMDSVRLQIEETRKEMIGWNS